jgi:hypothetical protein
MDFFYATLCSTICHDPREISCNDASLHRLLQGALYFGPRVRLPVFHVYSKYWTPHRRGRAGYPNGSLIGARLNVGDEILPKEEWFSETKYIVIDNESIFM